METGFPWHNPGMLSERIERFVRAAAGDDPAAVATTDTFDTLVSEAFALHYEQSEPMRRLAGEAGLGPNAEVAWQQVPMVPTVAFKSMRLAVAEAREIFHSSGTTEQAPSIHYHPYPELYRAVIEATFPQALLGACERPEMLSLIPTRADAPHSSLAFMVEHVIERWGGNASRTVVGAHGIKAAELRGFLAARQRDGRPTLVLATTIALAQLVDSLDRLQLNFRLPAGSLVFETGGDKGRHRELTRDQLVAALVQRLGLPPTAFVREYGMTELTSHFYQAKPESEIFAAPAWVRFRVLDVETLSEVEAGVPGLLAVFDLANVGSALHLLTEDLAVAEQSGFRLVGRAAGAELRGCSLLSEELGG